MFDIFTLLDLIVYVSPLIVSADVYFAPFTKKRHLHYAFMLARR